MSNQVKIIESGGVPEKLTSAEGRAIMNEVRIAMSNATLVKVPPNRIRPLEGQPRVNFNEDRLQKLSESMQEVGQLMPGIIRTISTDSEGHDYELLDGERRWRSVIKASIPTYRALQVEISNKAAPFVVSVISNFNRESHTTLEVLDSIIKMHEKLGLTLSEIADIIGFGYQSVSNFYTMRKLAPVVRDMLDPELMPAKKTLPVSAAIQIARLPITTQLALAQRVMNKEVNLTNLRTEVIKVAKKAGIEVNEPMVTAKVLRRRMDARVRLFASQAATLEKTFDITGLQNVLKGFSVDMILSLEKSLEQATEHADRVHKLLVEARSNTQFLIKKK